MTPGMTRESWWTWNADLPAEMRHLSSGFILTPVLYAASENNPSRLPPGDGVVFGPRAIGDEEIRLGLTLAGTRLGWRYGLDGAGGLSLDWRTEAFGEWGLRFWILLCVHGGPEAYFRFNRSSGELEGRSGGRRLKLRADKAPLLVTAHEDLAALEAELVDKGYFYLGSRAVEGGFLALRFNLEEAPEMRVEISVDGTKAPVPQEPVQEDRSELQGALQAVHDVMSWNHVYDFVNGRPYTALSRFWNSRKFGGFGVWLDDILFNAWLWGHFETARARDNLEAVFAWQTEAGNFPCLVTGNDAWLDRSQPPIGAFVVWSLFARSGERELLERAYPGLLRNYYWWWARRRLGDTGLICYGTSLDAGDGLYKGTKLAAKDESTMDNSPLHDSVPFDEASGLLLAADVGLNALAALDGEVLALMARTLGQDAEADELERQVAAHKARIAEWLWDETRQVFANRMLDGTFVAPLAPTSFYPLVAGIGTPEQRDALVERHLRPEDKFGGAFALPSVTRDDPAYGDNVYWRGRIWGPLNFWAYQGLRRAGLEGEAAALAEKSLRLFLRGWQARQCGENYNAETGAIGDQPDTDGFYSWGALLPALAVGEHLDMTPWAGWSLMGPPAGTRLGPLLTPAGRVFLSADASSWRLEREDGRVMLASNLRGRISQVSLTGKQPEVLLPAIDQDDAWIAFPSHESAVCGLAGEKLRRRDGRFALPRHGNAVRLKGLTGGA
jgi:putative isomerase